MTVEFIGYVVYTHTHVIANKNLSKVYFCYAFIYFILFLAQKVIINKIRQNNFTPTGPVVQK